MTGFDSKQRMAADKNNWKRGSIALARQLCYEIAGATNGDDDISGCEYGSVDIAEILSAEIERLREALAQPAQEPVALVIDGVLVKSALPEKYTGHLYTTPPQPAQEPDALTIAYQSGFYDGKKAALAGREWNFCERCGKRTNDIHTCTPPQGDA